MSKYKSKKIDYEGMTFDSKKELQHWIDLKQQEEQGIISDLKRQVEFELVPRQEHNGKFLYRPIKYTADMTYMKDGEYVVEDVKSKMTRKLPEYIMKKKLLYFTHNIILKEIV